MSDKDLGFGYIILSNKQKHYFQSHAEAVEAQKYLGFDPAHIDGDFGPKSRAKAEAFFLHNKAHLVGAPKSLADLQVQHDAGKISPHLLVDYAQKQVAYDTYHAAQKDGKMSVKVAPGTPAEARQSTGPTTVTRTENGGGVSVTATLNVDGKPGVGAGGYVVHGKTEEGKNTDGSTHIKTGRTTVDIIDNTNRFPTMPDRSKAADRATAAFGLDHQKNQRTEMDVAQKGADVTANVKTTSLASHRGLGSKFEGNITSHEATAPNGDKTYTDKGEGIFSRLWPFGKKHDVTVDGQASRVADTTKLGTLANEHFVIADKQTGKLYQVSDSSVQRYLDKDGKNVAEFAHEMMKGEKGSLNHTYAVLQVTQNKDDHSKFSYRLLDSGLGWHQNEAGKGKISLTDDGLKRSKSGVRSIGEVNLETASLIWNGQAFTGNTKVDIQLQRQKDGTLGAVAGTVKQHEVDLVVGGKVGFTGIGLFAGLMVQGDKVKTDQDFIAKEIGEHGTASERLVFAQHVLQAKGLYKGKIDGEAVVGGDTNKALVAYFNSGGTAKDLEKEMGKYAGSNEGKAAKEAFYTEHGIKTVATKDYQYYNGGSVTVDGYTYSQAQIAKAQSEAIGSYHTDTVQQYTTVLVADGKGHLKGVNPAHIGGFSSQLGGAECAIISLDSDKISFGATLGDKVPLNITTLGHGKVVGTQTSSITVPSSSLPTPLMDTLIFRHPKEHTPEEHKKPKESTPPKTTDTPPTTPQTPPPVKPKPPCPNCNQPTVTPQTPTPVPTIPTPAPGEGVGTNPGGVAASTLPKGKGGSEYTV